MLINDLTSHWSQHLHMSNPQTSLVTTEDKTSMREIPTELKRETECNSQRRESRMRNSTYKVFQILQLSVRKFVLTNVAMIQGQVSEFLLATLEFQNLFFE